MKTNNDSMTSEELRKEYSKKRFERFDDPELEEILACMEDSDRYINEGNKNNIIRDIKIELHNRGCFQY